jgi:hypothetical protein
MSPLEMVQQMPKLHFASATCYSIPGANLQNNLSGRREIMSCSQNQETEVAFHDTHRSFLLEVVA